MIEDANTERLMCRQRREFLRTAAAGAIGSLAVLEGRASADAATILGEITLDALMVTYFAAPLGNGSTATYTLGRAYDSTFSLASPKAPELVFRSSVPASKSYFFAGDRQIQSESRRVRGALTFSRRYRSGETDSISLAPPQSEDHTAFVGLYRPRLLVIGRPDRPRFRFMPGRVEDDGSALLVTNAAQLRSNPGGQGISATTAASWLPQIESNPTDVGPPRYLQEHLVSGGLGITIFMPAPSDAGPGLATTLSTSIVASSVGGELAGLFGVGDTLDLTYYAVQEDRTGTLLALELTTDRDTPQGIVWDTLWRTHRFVPM